MFLKYLHCEYINKGAHMMYLSRGGSLTRCNNYDNKANIILKILICSLFLLSNNITTFI